MKNAKKVCIVTLSLVFLFITISMTSVRLKANAEDPTLEIRYCNLSFRDSVCIKYAVSAKNTTDIKMLIWNLPQSDYTIGTESEQITSVGKNTIDGEDYVIFDYSKLVAKQMTDVVYARAYTQVDGVDYYSEVNKYSILQYAYNKLGKTATESTDENLKAMLTDMLEYGASAQKYFEHNSDRLATDCFYQVKLTDGVLYDGCTHGLYLEGDKIELSAPEKNSDDVVFSYWADSKGNKVSTTSTFELTVGTSNEVYTPIYNEATTYLVTFKDYDGTVLKTENVESGKSATPPADPTRSGYVFTGWNCDYTNVVANTEVIATYSKNTVPALSVNNTTTTAGTEKVKVLVSLENNPGFLTMALKITFDSDVLTLTKVSNGVDFTDYNFTGPKNKISGCTAAWFASDLPEEILDGDIMTLQFTVAADAAPGRYPITISCPDDGSTVDGNKNAFNMSDAIGYIIVE